jgi:sterol-4alpha-carboxylate 3-dehydrogenase (decarboxylating)
LKLCLDNFLSDLETVKNYTSCTQSTSAGKRISKSGITPTSSSGPKYVGNIAYAHILAADKLVPLSTEQDEDWQSDTPTLKEEEIAHYPLPPITLTTGTYRVPTSEMRPLGPYVTRPSDGDKIEAAFNRPNTFHNRPIIRSRFDQFSDIALARAETSPLDVAGQVFFITNGEPIYYWDFMHMAYHQIDIIHEQLGLPVREQRSLIKFSRSVATVLSGLSEWWGWLTLRLQGLGCSLVM